MKEHIDGLGARLMRWIVKRRPVELRGLFKIQDEPAQQKRWMKISKR